MSIHRCNVESVQVIKKIGYQPVSMNSMPVLHRPVMQKCILPTLPNAMALSGCAAFYLPGVAPHDYEKSELVPLSVNTLTPSYHQQQQQQQQQQQKIESVISFDYYYEQFHFCQPPHPSQQPENLGSILLGDRIFNSPFELKMQIDEQCKVLCTTPVIPKEDAIFINERIKEGYHLNWVVDGLPAANEAMDSQTGEPYYKIGFPLGSITEDKPFLNNHYHIKIYYHRTQKKGLARVVGFVVNPSSIADNDINGNACRQHYQQPQSPFYLREDGETTIRYTYTVEWVPSDTVWATRWDGCLHVSDPSIHWFSLINSTVVVLFLTGLMAAILRRALHKDISRYNRAASYFHSDDDNNNTSLLADEAHTMEMAQEDYGWKLVHGDIFRCPSQRPMLLSVLVGNGVQLMVMTAVTLVFAVLGFLSPSNRGSLATMMLLFFMVFSCLAGFTSARIYKMNGGEAWKTNMIMTATLLPGVLVSGLVGLNFILIYSNASGAIPFGTMLTVACLYLLISFPLSIFGSYVGFVRLPAIEHPVRTNQIPRQIPEEQQPLFLRKWPSIFMGGLLPFGAIFIELYFIMNSIWFHRIYYGIGFLFLVFALLILTCAHISALMCYFHICQEDYRWSWRAFLTAGATGFYVYAYSFLYYFTKLNITTITSTILYFGYSSMISLVIFVMTGSVGYLTCLLFLRKIFGSVKVD
ncbi:Endomembrane protein 70-domain-containing protein [Mycotypha africana]|uniref:Endomembrane protein 70-domain-containing protein n=1 Tax=Mycotypha africana TaxID=64632 RepID=UPI002300E632|nr:Endomembrane protein 70-domain-containing protein [Mycotypha africana]KAI8991139.1 Endomembrane protein 70-domain-containing protein [Mycotypha africana]